MLEFAGEHDLVEVALDGGDDEFAGHVGALELDAEAGDVVYLVFVVDNAAAVGAVGFGDDVTDLVLVGFFGVLFPLHQGNDESAIAIEFLHGPRPFSDGTNCRR